jgi:uncharacterized protein YjeT (DUF2065 family)
MPTTHTWANVKSAYDKARKAHPTLTPAAWRKAAAQSLGMPYDDFLKIWKTKGKTPGYPVSAPTTPAAAAPGPGMGLTTPKPASGLGPAAKSYLDNLDNLIKAGDETLEDAIKTLDLMVPKANFTNGELAKVQAALKKYKAATKADEAAAQAAKEAAIDVIETELGPLTHDLAKGIYNQMKKSMPGGTPATWRKAAAEYLNVDYNDYLKAWKKPTTAAAKAKTVPKSQWPPVTEPPLTPGSVGKWSNKEVSIPQLKDDIARLMGPEANPNFMDLVEVQQGTWHLTLPQSVLKTPAARESVKEAIEKMGLKVHTDPNNNWKISIHSEYVAKMPKKITQVDSHGNDVWIEARANEWTRANWSTLPKEVQNEMRDYSGSGYTYTNNALRGKVGYPMTAERAREARLISKGMKRTDHAFTVYRGTDIDIRQFREGGLWSDKGFFSTSISRSSGWGGHSSVEFVIEVPKGTKGFYLNHESYHPEEKEFLLDKGTKFRVTKIIGKVVYMTVVPH